MSESDDLEALAQQTAARLEEELVATSEEVDFQMGTYLLAAVAAELGQQVQRRCLELARQGHSAWEVAAADAESLINGAWRCMESIRRLSGGRW